MIQEFAIEPAAIDNWKDFRFIYAQAGVEHGRLISRFPRKWDDMVMKACKANPDMKDIERSRIVSRLQNIKNKMAKLNRPYDPEKNWMFNVQIQQTQNPFHAVIVRHNEINADNFLNIDDLDEQHLWQISKGRVVPRRAWDLACCARLLLQVSRQIIIIDPNFDPAKPRFIETFQYMITFAFEQHAPERLELHAEYQYHKDQKRKNGWKEDCIKNIPALIPEGFKIGVFQWEAKRFGDRPHARYILTERGGICYDYGIDEGDGQTTDVSLIDHSVYEQRWRDYQKETAAYHLNDNFSVTGSKKNPQKET